MRAKLCVPARGSCIKHDGGCVATSTTVQYMHCHLTGIAWCRDGVSGNADGWKTRRARRHQRTTAWYNQPRALRPQPQTQGHAHTCPHATQRTQLHIPAHTAKHTHTRSITHMCIRQHTCTHTHTEKATPEHRAIPTRALTVTAGCAHCVGAQGLARRRGCTSCRRRICWGSSTIPTSARSLAPSWTSNRTASSWSCARRRCSTRCASRCGTPPCPGSRVVLHGTPDQ